MNRNSKLRWWPVMLVMGLIVCSTVTAVASSSEEGHEHGATTAKGWVVTDTYRVMNFAVLAIGLFLILRKPVSKALNDRIKGIENQLKDLETRKNEAENLLAGYNEKLALIDQEAEKIIADYARQGEEAKKRSLDQAQNMAAKLEEQAGKNIANEFAKARVRIQTEILEKALAKAEEGIRSGINGADQDRLVDEYLAKVVA